MQEILSFIRDWSYTLGKRDERESLLTHTISLNMMQNLIHTEEIYDLYGESIRNLSF